MYIKNSDGIVGEELEKIFDFSSKYSTKNMVLVNRENGKILTSVEILSDEVILGFE